MRVSVRGCAGHRTQVEALDGLLKGELFRVLEWSGTDIGAVNRATVPFLNLRIAKKYGVTRMVVHYQPSKGVDRVFTVSPFAATRGLVSKSEGRIRL